MVFENRCIYWWYYYGAWYVSSRWCPILVPGEGYGYVGSKIGGRLVTVDITTNVGGKTRKTDDKKQDVRLQNIKRKS